MSSDVPDVERLTPALQTVPSGGMFRGTGALAAAAIVQRSLGLLLLPLFTRVLSPTEYGQIGVIAAISAALSTFVGLSLDTALLRAFVQSGGQGQAARVLINTVGGFAILLPLSVSALLIALLPSLPPFLGLPTDALRLALVGAAATTAATVVPLALFRAQGRYGDYLRLTGIQVLLTTALAIVFVAVLRWGVTGWVLASAAGSVLLLALGLATLRHRWTWEIDLQPLGHALAFGLPLLPHALAHWGLALSDRAILGAFVPDAEIGQYYVAYQACLPVTVLAIAVSRATQPTFAAAANSEQHRREIAQNSTIQAVLVALAAASIALIGPPLIRLALPLSYARAAEFLPWLALGSGLFGLYLIPMNAIAVMAGRTRRVWIITGLAAALNIGLNLVTIPRIGAQAAAINTAVGYGALLVGVTIYMRSGSHPQIPFEEFRLAKGLGLIALAWLLAALLTPSNPTGALVMGLAAMVGASIILVRGVFYREATTLYRTIRARSGGTAR